MLDNTLRMLYNKSMKKYKKKPWSNEECKVILVNYNYVDKVGRLKRKRIL